MTMVHANGVIVAPSTTSPTGRFLPIVQQKRGNLKPPPFVTMRTRHQIKKRVYILYNVLIPLVF